MTHEWYEKLNYEQSNAIRNGVIPNGVDNDTAARYIKLRAEVMTEIKNPRINGPRATSAYDTVSAFPANEPMPEWTETKSRKNVQRVDVVLPEKTLKERAAIRNKYAALSEEEKAKTTYQSRILWSPDNLHENLPDTLGWAMIQYVDKPELGGKVAVVGEAQSRWGQTLREQQKQISERAQAGIKTAGERDISHPLLKEYNLS